VFYVAAFGFVGCILLFLIHTTTVSTPQYFIFQARGQRLGATQRKFAALAFLLQTIVIW
jgi:hypothetical protein